MNLASRCLRSFEVAVRTWGMNLYLAREVKIEDTDLDVVRALVGRGPAAQHRVTVRVTNMNKPALSAQCQCQRAQSELCEHVWATLLQVDRDAHSAFLVPGKDWVPITLMDPEEQHAEAIEDEWPSGGPSADPRAPLGRSNGATPAVRRAAKKVAAWQHQLARIQANSRRAAGMDHSTASQTRRQELWYVLDISDALRSGNLELHLYIREWRRDGTPGKIKQHRQVPGDVSQLQLEEDRRIISCLLGAGTAQPRYQSYTYYDPRPRVSSAIVQPSTYDLLLPQLCDSGRLVWTRDRQESIEDARPLAYDGALPYRLKLDLAPEKSRRMWQLTGSLVRGDECVPLTDPVMLMSCGLVIFPDRIARFDGQGTFGWIIELRREGRILIPFRHGEKFLQSLQELPVLPQVQWPENLPVTQRKTAPQGVLCLTSQRNIYGELQAALHFAYDQQRIARGDARGALLLDDNVVIARDPALEQQLEQQLLTVNDVRFSSEHDGGVLINPRKLPDVVNQLIAQGWIVEAEGHAVRRSSGLQLSVKSRVDWFELEGAASFGDQQVPMPRLLAALRKGETFVRLDDGSHGMLPEQWLQQYGWVAELADLEDGSSSRFKPSQALLLDSLLADANVEFDASFAELRERLRSFSGIAPSDAPDSFQGQLRSYQRDGLGWLEFLREFRFGGCLADDMGLGKTIQVLALLEQQRQWAGAKDSQQPASADDHAPTRDGHERLPSLVVVPKSLVFNWIDEAARFTPAMRVMNYTGMRRAEQLDRLAEYDLIVTTYGTMRKDILTLKEYKFDYVILDESQAIKNAQSQSAKASRLLQARHRLAMTGTPIENHLGELWSLFEFLNPGMLGRASSFQARSSGPAADDANVQNLSQGLRPFMLRRTKQQVLSELPEKTELTMYCEMSSRQRKYYDELRNYYQSALMTRVKQHGIAKAKIHVLEALLRLRQAACHPGLLDRKLLKHSSAKLDTLLEQLQEVIEEGHKALVFSQFTSLLQIVSDELTTRRLDFEYLDGKTTRRKAHVERFQNDPACKLFLISLKAGGQGLNLTAADYVFILDPWWNPAAEAQAIDRAHRMGQQRHVFAYRLICRDTIEEKVLELQRSKRELADAILTEDNSLLRNLTVDDLTLLLS